MFLYYLNTSFHPSLGEIHRHPVMTEGSIDTDVDRGTLRMLLEAVVVEYYLGKFK